MSDKFFTDMIKLMGEYQPHVVQVAAKVAANFVHIQALTIKKLELEIEELEARKQQRWIKDVIKQAQEQAAMSIQPDPIFEAMEKAQREGKVNVTEDPTLLTIARNLK